MSGPNDSGSGDTPTGDFKLQLDVTEPQPPSSRFRLKLHFETPRLEWRPAQTTSGLSTDKPEFLKLDDPLAAVLRAERYFACGAMLFDMKRPDFDVLDMAFLAAPTDPPALLPSFAQMKALEDEAFYKRLGRTHGGFIFAQRRQRPAGGRVVFYAVAGLSADLAGKFLIPR